MTLPSELSGARRLAGNVRKVVVTQETTAFLGLLAVIAVFAATTSTFLTPYNLFQITRQMALLTVIAVGMTLVISAGEIDISVGAIYNLSANVMAILIARANLDPWLAAVAALAISVVAGAMNGILSVSLGLPTLIVTLGTVSLYRGITIMVSGGLSIGNLPESSLYAIGSQRLGPFPYLAIIAVIIVAVTAWLYRNTVFARELLAIGSNRDAAMRTGVRVRVRKIQLMALNGLMCGIAAVMGLAYLRSASPQSGTGFEFVAIAAAVVGGTPLQGGVGTVWGTLIGLALLVAIQNGLLLMGLPVAWQVASTGVMLLVAVAVQQVVRLRSARA